MNPFIPKPVPEQLLTAARALRSTMTDAERLLWSCLRRKQLGGFRFRRQHPFEMYVLDFYCCEARVAIELDGGQHNEPEAKARDAIRTAFLAGQGIYELRFWNNEVFVDTEGVLQKIYAVVSERTQTPPPEPSPAGGGEVLFWESGDALLTNK